jgi:hypothetical protein
MTKQHVAHISTHSSLLTLPGSVPGITLLKEPPGHIVAEAFSALSSKKSHINNSTRPISTIGRPVAKHQPPRADSESLACPHIQAPVWRCKQLCPHPLRLLLILNPSIRACSFRLTIIDVATWRHWWPSVLVLAETR